MKRLNSVPPVEAVAIAKIETKEPRGGRRTAKEIEVLKNDFTEHGQLVAVILSREEGAQVYTLLAGSKRFEAAKLLGWKEIKAVVIPIEPESPAELLKDWVKYIEKHQEYELDHYALAEAAIHMEEKWKVKGSEFARQLGLSSGYIYNLMRWYRNIPKEVREAWRKGSPLINQAELERYSHMPRQEALAAWELRCRMRAAAFEPFTPGKKKKTAPAVSNSEGPKVKHRRASEQEIMSLQRAIDNAPIIKPVKSLVSNVLRYVLGIEKNVKGVTTFHVELPTEIVDKSILKAREKEARESRAAV